MILKTKCKPGFIEKFREVVKYKSYEKETEFMLFLNKEQRKKNQKDKEKQKKIALTAKKARPKSKYEIEMSEEKKHVKSTIPKDNHQFFPNSNA